MTTSVLDEMPGLGPARRRRLLRELGGVRALRAASEEELVALGVAPRRGGSRRLPAAPRGPRPAGGGGGPGAGGRRRADWGRMIELLVVTGMSGAGRSTAGAALEDLGWFVIDNLPVELIPKVAELVRRPGSDTERVALVIGRGGGESLDGALAVLDSFQRPATSLRILFLDAPDEVLVRRFEGTRRRHPLAARGVEESIADERQLLEPLRGRADVVLDTGELNVNQLRARILELFGRPSGEAHMQTSIVSFGYKHGVPLDVDLLFDCRFLPNPYWVEALRPQSGLDPGVRDYVLGLPETPEFLWKVDDLLTLLIPAFVREGKSYLTVALGCTGGRHRSVALAEELRRRMGARGLAASVFHRDIDR